MISARPPEDVLNPAHFASVRDTCAAAGPEQWNTIARRMRESGSPLPASHDPRQAYTDRFIARINGFDRGGIEAQAREWKD